MPEPLYTGSPATHASWDGLTSWVDLGNGQAERLDALGHRTGTTVNVNDLLDLRPYQEAQKQKDETKGSSQPSKPAGGAPGGGAPSSQRARGPMFVPNKFLTQDEMTGLSAATRPMSSYVAPPAPVSSPNSVPTTGVASDPNRGLSPGSGTSLAQRQQQQAALSARAARMAGAYPSAGRNLWQSPGGSTYETVTTPDGATVVRKVAPGGAMIEEGASQAPAATQPAATQPAAAAPQTSAATSNPLVDATAFGYSAPKAAVPPPPEATGRSVTTVPTTGLVSDPNRGKSPGMTVPPPAPAVRYANVVPPAGWRLGLERSEDATGPVSSGAIAAAQAAAMPTVRGPSVDGVNLLAPTPFGGAPPNVPVAVDVPGGLILESPPPSQHTPYVPFPSPPDVPVEVDIPGGRILGSPSTAWTPATVPVAPAAPFEYTATRQRELGPVVGRAQSATPSWTPWGNEWYYPQGSMNSAWSPQYGTGS